MYTGDIEWAQDKAKEDIFERLFHSSVEFVEKAIAYENSQDSPYAALCLKKQNFKNHGRLIKLSLLIVFGLLEVGTFALAFKHLGIAIVISGFTTFVFNHLLNDICAQVKKAYPFDYFLLNATKEYRNFLKIIRYHFGIYPDLSILGLSYFRYDSQITFKLFNRVMTFAFNSFTLADTQDNERALEEILRPMVTDLIQEAIDNYEKFLKLERVAARNESKQLQNQIDLDLHAYKNRLFK